MEFYELREQSELFSLKYEDIYWSKDGGWEEKNYIFLDSILICERWQASTQFQILELGFGAGINFLATLKAWKDSGFTEKSLQYISIEENPLPVAILKNIYKTMGLSEDLYGEFLNSYAFIGSGSHILKFVNESLSLHLLVGDVSSILKNLSAEIDVMYLDGFSPSKNPKMWDIEIFKELFRLTKEDGIFTTYSTAKFVKENAISAGFEIQKLKGFGTKKWMLHGRKNKNQQNIPLHPYYSLYKSKRYKKASAIVIGGGLAGTSIAKYLSLKNHSVLLIEREGGLAYKTSGNPAGIINPNITADKSPISLLELNAYYHLQRTLSEYSNIKDFRYGSIGLYILSNDIDKKNKGIESHNVQNLYKNKIDPILNREGIYLPSGSWIDPVSLCNTNIKTVENSNPIKIELNTNALNYYYSNDLWNIEDSRGNHYKSEVLILANSIDANNFSLTKWLPVRKFRGQIIYLDKDIFPFSLDHIYIMDECYLIPQNNYTIVGATYQKDSDNLQMDTHDSIELVERLKKDFSISNKINFDTIQGRAGIRATTPDHLPIIGPVPDLDFFESEYKDLYKGGRGLGKDTAKYHDGLYIFTGFGSKGILYTNYLAEILVRLIEKEFTGLENFLLDAVLPNRFIIRRLSKRKGYSE
jgi:tRNA 5-methylaminomethyl-2-thiouridine biosynthesis bifunctional protein